MFDYGAVLSEIAKRVDSFDVSLENLRVVKLPKDVQCATKEIQTDNSQQISLSNISICNLQESVDITSTVSKESSKDFSLLEYKKETIKELPNKDINLYCPKYIRKEEKKNTSIDLSNHLNEVVKNIAREFRMPMKYRNKAKHKYITNI